MTAFASFGLPVLIVLIVTGPVIPYIWKRGEKASAVMMTLLALVVMAGAAFVWSTYTGVNEI